MTWVVLWDERMDEMGWDGMGGSRENGGIRFVGIGMMGKMRRRYLENGGGPQKSG